MYAPFVWTAVALPLLLISQRWIHRHLHGVAYLLTGNRQWAVVLYAIVLFPGVLLHELSHWVAAKLMGVRTGKISLLPRAKKDGSVQLGYVEYYKTADLGAVRESLIGAAPLLAGTAVILLISFHIFTISALLQALQIGDLDPLLAAISQIIAADDFLVWLYLLFAVSNAMMPSASDRRAWPTFLAIIVGVIILLYLLGMEEWLARGLYGPGAIIAGYLALAFTLTLIVNLFFILLIAFLELLISWIKGVRLNYD